MTSNGSTFVPIPADIVDLTGPLVIGLFFNWGLFGVLTVQAYLYYIAFPNDRVLPTKVLAYSIYIFEVAQTVITTRDGFRSFGSGWGNIIVLDEVGMYWIGVPVMTSIVSGLGQIFYAWRIWVLKRKTPIPVIIIVLALAQAGAGIWAGGWAHQVGHFSGIQTITYKNSSVWLAGTALCDVIVATSMTYTLLTSRTGVRSTNTLIIRIVRLTIETGAACALFAILDLVLYLRFPHNNMHLTPSITLSKLYSNSLFAVLNSRMRIIGSRTGDTTTFDGSLSLSSGIDMIGMVKNRAGGTAGLNVAISTSTITHHDEESATVEPAKYSSGRGLLLDHGNSPTDTNINTQHTNMMMTVSDLFKEW